MVIHYRVTYNNDKDDYRDNYAGINYSEKSMNGFYTVFFCMAADADLWRFIWLII